MTPPTPSEALAEEIERGVTLGERIGSEYVTVRLDMAREVITSLRAGPLDGLKAAYCEGYEDALKDKGPPGMVLVPREPTAKMVVAAMHEYQRQVSVWLQTRGPLEPFKIAISFIYDAMLAAASSGGKK